MRSDVIVPFTVELVPVNVDYLEFGVCHFDLERIVFLIQPRMNLEARRCACGSDQVDHDLGGFERNASPVAGDVAEQAVLDLVPLARPWRIVADIDRQARGIGESLKFEMPESGARAVAPAAVCRDQETCGFCKSLLAELLPSELNRGDCELGGVVADSNAGRGSVVLIPIPQPGSDRNRPHGYSFGQTSCRRHFRASSCRRGAHSP